MSILTIDAGNVEAEHICCAIGNDKVNQARALTKKRWFGVYYNGSFLTHELMPGKKFSELCETLRRRG